MLENLNVLKGLLLSEPVMFHLGEKIGKQTAHEVVYQISMKAFQEGGSFRDYLLNDDRVNKHMTAAEIDRLLDPYAYTGYSREIAERVLAKGRAARCRRSLDFGKR
jgi:adenylosuccinate lyase